jgi:hypothetical protein
MTIKQQGGIFGRNPTFNNVGVNGSLTGLSNLSISGNLIVASGFGIDFSATAGTGTSELFDDYEEGTWTPAFSYTTPNDVSFTYAAQTGLYTKVGNLVTVSFEITLSAFSKNTAAGAFIVTGLPYTVASSDKSTGAMSLDNTTYFADPVIASRPNATSLFMNRNRSNNTDASFDPSATSRISGSITYRV